MQTDDRLGHYRDIVARQPQHAAVLDALRAMVASALPDGFEGASAREGSLWWGTGPRKMTDGIAWCMPFKSHVNFGFMHGAALDDPGGLLTGTGKAMRHAKIKSVAEAEAPALRKLLDAAIARHRAKISEE